MIKALRILFIIAICAGAYFFIEHQNKKKIFIEKQNKMTQMLQNNEYQNCIDAGLKFIENNKNVHIDEIKNVNSLIARCYQKMGQKPSNTYKKTLELFALAAKYDDSILSLQELELSKKAKSNEY